MISSLHPGAAKAEYAPKVTRARNDLMELDKFLKLTAPLQKVPFLKKIHQNLVEKKESLLKTHAGKRALRTLQREGYSQ